MSRLFKPLLLKMIVATGCLMACIGFLYGQTPSLDWAVGVGGSLRDEATALVVDAFGNSYVGGVHYGDIDLDPGSGVQMHTGEGIYIQKFDPTGHLIWAVNFANTQFARVQDLALDANGNLLAVGMFEDTLDFDPGPGVEILNTFSYGDAFLLQLTPAGNFGFVRDIAPSGGLSNNTVAHAVTVDSDGNILVVGKFSGTSDFDPGPAIHYLISEGGTDAFLAKYDSTGNYLWAKSFGGTAGDEARDVTVDATGDPTVVGSFCFTVDFDPGVGVVNLTANSNFSGFVLGLDAAGTFEFVEKLDGPNSNTSSCLPYEIKTDPSGDLVIGGYFIGTIGFDPNGGVPVSISEGGQDIFVLKMDPVGNYLWSYVNGNLGADGTYSLEVDNGGNIYFASYFNLDVDFNLGAGIDTASSNPYTDIAVVKLDPSGAFVWLAAADGAGRDYPSKIALGPQNEVYVTGYFALNGSQTDFDPSVAVSNLTSVGNADGCVYRLMQENTTLVALAAKPVLVPFPNPNAGGFQLDLRGLEPILIPVTAVDAMGKVVWQGNLMGGGMVPVALNGVADGVYCLRLGLEQAGLGTRVVVRR